MTIEADDAGIGSPLLGEAFILRRVETDESVFGYFPLRSDKSRLSLLQDLLIQINPTKDEKIILCQGNVFDSFQKYLIKENYIVERGKIIGKTNDLIEDYFYNLLLDIGLPKTISLSNRNYPSFYSSMLIWYKTFLKDSSFLKSSFLRQKPHYRDYLHYSILSYPNLLHKLFYD